jgi:hypothetical protein
MRAQVLTYASAFNRKRVAQLAHELAAIAPASAASAVASKESATVLETESDKLRNELNSLVAGDCPFCGCVRCTACGVRTITLVVQ